MAWVCTVSSQRWAIQHGRSKNTLASEKQWVTGKPPRYTDCKTSNISVANCCLWFMSSVSLFVYLFCKGHKCRTVQWIFIFAHDMIFLAFALLGLHRLWRNMRNVLFWGRIWQKWTLSGRRELNLKRISWNRVRSKYLPCEQSPIFWTRWPQRKMVLTPATAWLFH